MPSTGMLRASAPCSSASSALGAAGFQRHRLMPLGIAIQRRVDVERAAGHDQPVQPVQIIRRQPRIMRQRHGQAAGRRQRRGVVLPQRVPGVFRPAAGRLGIQGQSNQWAFYHGCT